MSSIQSQTIHPEIASIIRKRDEIHRLIFVEYHPRKALGLMVGLMYSLRREHRDDELLVNIRKERIVYERTVSKRQLARYAREMRPEYEDYYQQLSDVLNNEGYLTSEFYRGITPAESLKKERATPPVDHFPERLPENLK